MIYAALEIHHNGVVGKDHWELGRLRRQKRLIIPRLRKRIPTYSLTNSLVRERTRKEASEGSLRFDT